MHKIFSRLAVLAWLLAAAASPAQTPPAAAAPTERAQRDADKVFQMILQHADTPRRGARDEAKAAAAPAPALPAAARIVAAPTAARSQTQPQPQGQLSGKPQLSTSTPPALLGESVGPASDNLAALAAVQSPPRPAAAAPVAAETTAAAAVQAPVATALPRSLKLELIASVEPEFPARLVRTLGSGSVVVNFDVQPDGSVSRTDVVSSSHRGLNDAARAAVAAWRFKPVSETLPGIVELKFE